jgi:hypothetical protein
MQLESCWGDEDMRQEINETETYPPPLPKSFIKALCSARGTGVPRGIARLGVWSGVARVRSSGSLGIIVNEEVVD